MTGDWTTKKLNQVTEHATRKKQGDHAWHFKLQQERDEIGKILRGLRVIKSASLPLFLIYITHKINRKSISKSHWALCYILDTCPLKLAHILIQGSVYNQSRTSPNETFIYFCGLSITELLYKTETHKYICPPCRHKEGTKFPAGPIRLVKCLLWAFVVLLELVESHLHGDKWENQQKLDVLQMELQKETPEQYLWCQTAHCMLILLFYFQIALMIKMCFIG